MKFALARIVYRKSQQLRVIDWCWLATVGGGSLVLLWMSVNPHFYYMAHVIFLVLYWVNVAFVTLLRSELRATFGPPPSSHRTRAFLSRWAIGMAAVPLVTTALIVGKIPLRLGFLTALPALQRLVESAEAGERPEFGVDRQCGIFRISGRLRECNIPGGHIFRLANDPEAGFVYSPSGIEHLRYNSGDKGWLFGDWHWFAED